MTWRWPWRRRDTDLSGEVVAAAEDAAAAAAARGQAEEAMARTESAWPRVERAAERMREIHAENHFADAIRAIYRG